MADRPQHSFQIMEPQTRFSLSSSVAEWRREMASQPGITSDQAHELESHLVESMNRLKQRGLTEEEAFWLARRRLGRCVDIAAEITKADPSCLWRDRVCWMATALLGGHLLLTLLGFASVFVTPFIGTFILGRWFSSPDAYRWTQQALLLVVTAGAGAIALMAVGGYVPKPIRVVAQINWPRRKLSWVLCFLVALETALEVQSIRGINSAAQVINMIGYFPLWPCLMAVLLVRLSPRRAAR